MATKAAHVLMCATGDAIRSDLIASPGRAQPDRPNQTGPTGLTPITPGRGARELTDPIRRMHSASRDSFDAPRIHADPASSGVDLGRKRVERLVRVAGLAGVARRQYARTPLREDHVRQPADRNFCAPLPRLHAIACRAAHVRELLCHPPTRASRPAEAQEPRRGPDGYFELIEGRYNPGRRRFWSMHRCRRVRTRTRPASRHGSGSLGRLPASRQDGPASRCDVIDEQANFRVL